MGIDTARLDAIFAQWRDEARPGCIVGLVDGGQLVGRGHTAPTTTKPRPSVAGIAHS